MPQPQLQPPPRVPAAGSGGPRTGADGPIPLGRIVSAILFSALTLGLVVVFIFLPRWQEGRQDAGPENVTNQAEPTPETPAIPPIESPLAANLNPTSRPTATAVVRPTQGVRQPQPTKGPSRTEVEFRDAMTEGLEALEGGRWEEARLALERAADLKPGAPEVADAFARAAAGQRREEIAARIRRARGHEDNEAWHEADEAYVAVLEMDPEAAAALEGHERAAYRADLDDRLDYHLRNPGRLASPVVLEDAASLLEEAWGVNPGGPRLAQQMTRLEQLIKTASTPVPVILESDNQTEVTVLRVGRFGTFFRREISLRPGNYTAVGSRAGFRDVRVRFAVAPGTSRNPVMIQCTDGI